MNKSFYTLILDLSPWSKLVFVLSSIVFYCIACQQSETQNVSHQEFDIPEVVDYNFHVRPILSDNCFSCHGPDAKKQKGKLRLDLEDKAFEKLESGSGYAFVKGNHAKSEAYQRMITDDPELIMPPPDSHLKLNPREIAIIKQWINDGAEYKSHWAFQAPKETEIPEVENTSWVKQPIDNFVLATLANHNLEPSEEASKESLVRRVTFDLTGLPPSLDDIDNFIHDNSPDAYEILVDRLLSSAAYGERMAADWMDVARYADSDGYLDDKHRDFHPWRDWVISAFNRNMPYDQFISYQLAGDQLPETTKESTLATAFNRLHKKNSEAGIVYEEYRVEYVADRTNTLGKAILGLSLECARCHDHKYDPISQKEYYQLFGFFNSTHEMGTPVYGPGQVPGPAMLLSSDLQDEEMSKIREYIVELEDKFEIQKKEENGFGEWQSKLEDLNNIEENIDSVTVAYYPLDTIQEGKKEGDYITVNELNKYLPATVREPDFRKSDDGNAFFVNDYNRIILGEKIGWYDRTDNFSFQLSVRPDTLYEEVGLLWHSEELRLGLKGYSLHLKENKLQFVMSMSYPQNAIQVKTITALPQKEWSQVTITYDGSSNANGIGIYINGERQEVEVEHDNLYKSILFVPDIHTYGFNGIWLGARDKFIPFKKGGIDEVKVFDRQLSSLEVLLLNDENKAKQILSNKVNHKDLLKEHFDIAVNDNLNSVDEELSNAREEENQLVSKIPEIMVMGDLAKPRPTYVLDRGAYDARGEEVEPTTPKAILPFDKSYSPNRYGLTQWLFDPDHPLTARVYVNRIWQMHFGKGIVKTSDDFGAQGSLPSHPALLDWLAIYFQKNNWDIKALHKMIVSSATYKQSSKVRSDHLVKDPENILLSRGPRYRLPAEMIRDNALAVSGLLVKKEGGESSYPYQPEGLWDGITTKSWAYRYLEEEGDGLYRRSLYTVWKRSAPPPFMQIFDLDDRGDCEVNRRMSSTPLQALNLLNDPQFVEASRVLAENIIQTEQDTGMRLHKVFRLLTGRQPDKIEQSMLEEFYQEELNHFSRNESLAEAYMSNGVKAYNEDLNASEIAALGVVANSIMNTTESYTKK